MGWRFPLGTIDNDCCAELSLYPVSILQRLFKSCDDRRAASPGCKHFTPKKPKSAESVLYFLPLLGEGSLENTNCIPPFVDLVELGYVWRN